jgi:transcriptional regulator with PAS, ATPase and Fis domain
MIQSGGHFETNAENSALFQRVFTDDNSADISTARGNSTVNSQNQNVIHLPQSSNANNSQPHLEVEESLSLTDSEKDLIVRALKKHMNKRKYAAQELGISERTLYRKIKEYNLHK